MRSDSYILIAIALFAVCDCGAQSSPSAIRAHINRAEAALRSNDQKTAVREFREALTLDPDNAEALANLGVMEFSQGDCASAEKDLGRAVALRPSLIKQQALLGLCQKRLGEPAAAKNLEAAFAKLPDVKMRTQIGLELAELYQEAGDLERTASTMGDLVALDPDNADILYFAQRTYSELADNTMNKLAVLAPGSARMQQTIAERLVNAGDLKNAIQHYRNSLQIDPHIRGVRFELAEALLESARLDPAAQAESEVALKAALAQEGDNANIECELARIATLRSDQKDAYAHYQQAFRLGPRNTDAQLGLGRNLMMMNQLPEARKYLELAEQSDPLNVEAHYRLVIIYRRLQLIDQAQKEARLVQEIKKTRDQVEALYRQMNRETKPQTEEMSDLPKD